MQQFLQFAINHWPLVAGFVLVLILISVEEARGNGLAGKRLSTQDATQLINRKEAVVVDLRDANAFRDGHIVGSKNVPIKDIDAQISKWLKHKEKDYILVFAMGQKVQIVMNKLRKAGLMNVHQLGGGINSWKSAGLPLVKGK